jgi:lipid-A-disaccharide synthase
MSSGKDRPIVYLLALEPSGDALGAGLIDEIRQELQGEVSFAGVGGPAMQERGLISLFDASDLALLGIFEVLPKARLVFRRVREVLLDIERVQPDILVTIDSWGFTGRIHKALTKRRSVLKRVRYVAPQVWAWRPGRAKQLSRWIDHLLTLFPFEPPLFEAAGLSTTWVGHPVVDRKRDVEAGARLRERLNISESATVLALLPGSRRSEVKSLTPVFSEAITQLQRYIPELVIVVPTVTGVSTEVKNWISTLPGFVHMLEGEADKFAALEASEIALAASGTVTLELARAQVPHVIAYKVNPLSAFVFRRLTLTKYVNLINIILDKQVIPECLQQDCTATQLARELRNLLKGKPGRLDQISAFDEALSQLTPPNGSASQAAALAVVKLLT